MNQGVAIEVSQLSKEYKLNKGTYRALNNVSFELKIGEQLAVIGANGSGKSTLLKILAGISKPSEGEVKIRGRLASVLDIGAGFHPDLSGSENIYLHAQLLGIKRSLIKQQFDSIVEFSGIRQFIKHPVRTYSSGMYLRLAFSIIVHFEFDIYLFDEILSVGDAEFSRKAEQYLDRIKKDKRKSIILVTHDLSQINSSSKVISLEKGVLKKGESKQILEEYIKDKVVKDFNGGLINLNTSLEGLSKKYPSHEISIKSILFKQKETDGKFVTGNPFIISIKYQVETSDLEVEPMITISNYNGRPILSTAPFMKEEFQNELLRDQHIEVEFPANFFSSQIYFISLYFIKNPRKVLKQLKHQKDVHESISETEILLNMHHFAAFKMNFGGQGTQTDLSSIDIEGALLIDLNWRHV